MLCLRETAFASFKSDWFAVTFLLSHILQQSDTQLETALMVKETIIVSVRFSLFSLLFSTSLFSFFSLSFSLFFFLFCFVFTFF